MEPACLPAVRVFIIAAVGGDADAQSASARPECACVLALRHV
uniref:Uncharacterized protein n=1 Tax=Zea mays TaxID=4577 RepID=C4J6G6_MAIZE|nr:unknown [Zea mays]